MRELTQQEYQDLFQTRDPAMIRHWCDQWNTSNDDKIQVLTRLANRWPLIYREQLPRVLEMILQDFESAGTIYVNAQWMLSTEEPSQQRPSV